MPDSSTIYDANDGGFFVGTIDWSGPFVTWVNKNAGLSTLQFYGGDWAWGPRYLVFAVPALLVPFIRSRINFPS